MVDTAVIGHLGGASDLGAIAFGALIFSFVYWGFGFLRMGTSGTTAQAAGAGDELEIRATFGRALGLALGLGVALVVMQVPIRWLALFLLDGSPNVEAMTAVYFDIRIWGAPASLGTFAALGVLVGLGRGRALLVVNLFLNGLNITLDVWLAGKLGWGVAGIAWGTVISEWCTLVLALVVVVTLLRGRRRSGTPFWPRDRLLDMDKMRETLVASSDILIRTLGLLFGFAWFTNQSAQFGDTVLAGNHILLQFISFSAFFLDGYAYVAESMVGAAIGARRPEVLRLAVRRSSVIACLTSLALAMVIFVGDATMIGWLTDTQAVRQSAGAFIPEAAVYVALAFLAFQLDGIFIGATRTRDMRNASVVSVLAFVAISLALMPAWGARGLWWSFIAYVVIRAATLFARYSAVVRRASG